MSEAKRLADGDVVEYRLKEDCAMGRPYGLGYVYDGAVRPWMPEEVITGARNVPVGHKLDELNVVPESIEVRRVYMERSPTRLLAWVYLPDGITDELVEKNARVQLQKADVKIMARLGYVKKGIAYSPGGFKIGSIRKDAGSIYRRWFVHPDDVPAEDQRIKKIADALLPERSGTDQQWLSREDRMKLARAALKAIEEDA